MSNSVKSRVLETFYAKLQESDAVTDGMLKELRALLKEKKVSADDVTGIFAAPPRDAIEAPKSTSLRR